MDNINTVLISCSALVGVIVTAIFTYLSSRDKATILEVDRLRQEIAELKVSLKDAKEREFMLMQKLVNSKIPL